MIQEADITIANIHVPNIHILGKKMLTVTDYFLGLQNHCT